MFMKPQLRAKMSIDWAAVDWLIFLDKKRAAAALLEGYAITISLSTPGASLRRGSAFSSNLRAHSFE